MCIGLFREAERSRMEEYERELMEMKERVQRRPLLFEQESQVSHHNAWNKFQLSLQFIPNLFVLFTKSFLFVRQLL